MRCAPSSQTALRSVVTDPYGPSERQSFVDGIIIVKRFDCKLCLLCISFLTSAVQADPPPKNHGFSTIDDVDRHLRDFIMKRFPKAEFSVTADTFVVKAKTMKYIVHHQHRGQVSERTYETEGPRHDGILLKIERRTGRLVGATLGRGQAMQTSPDKRVMLRCTSSSFTWAVDWNGFARDGPARLTAPALYDVSVRNLAALTRTCPGGDKQTRRLRTRSQASSPRSIARPQLPSSSTCLSRSIIWYTDIRKIPVSYRGLSPHNNHARAGRIQRIHPSPRKSLG